MAFANLNKDAYTEEFSARIFSNTISNWYIKVPESNHIPIITKTGTNSTIVTNSVDNDLNYNGLIYRPWTTSYEVNSWATTASNSTDYDYQTLKQEFKSIREHGVIEPTYITAQNVEANYYYDNNQYDNMYLGRFVNSEEDNDRFIYHNGTILFDNGVGKIENYDRIAKRNQIRSNLHIWVKSRADEIRKPSESEWVAMQTLRDMISESDFRKYIKYGFISVKGSSGKIYQIFRDRHHTKVFQNGELVEEICAMIKDRSIPPTDKLIAFKTIIETDEKEFKKMGNVYKRNKAA